MSLNLGFDICECDMTILQGVLLEFLHEVRLINSSHESHEFTEVTHKLEWCLEFDIYNI